MSSSHSSDSLSPYGVQLNASPAGLMSKILHTKVTWRILATTKALVSGLHRLCSLRSTGVLLVMTYLLQDEGFSMANSVLPLYEILLIIVGDKSNGEQPPF